MDLERHFGSGSGSGSGSCFFRCVVVVNEWLEAEWDELSGAGSPDREVLCTLTVCTLFYSYT